MKKPKKKNAKTHAKKPVKKRAAHGPRAKMTDDAQSSRGQSSRGPLIDSARQASETCFAWNGELLRFASERFHQDAELGFALTRCRSWTEAAELQRRWAMKTTEDWLNEGARLLRVATTQGTDAAQTAADQVEHMQS